MKIRKGRQNNGEEKIEIPKIQWDWDYILEIQEKLICLFTGDKYTDLYKGIKTQERSENISTVRWWKIKQQTIFPPLLFLINIFPPFYFLIKTKQRTPIA